MSILHFFKAPGSTFSHLHQRLLKPFNEAEIREINIRGKSILRAFRNNIANYSIRNDISYKGLRPQTNTADFRPVTEPVQNHFINDISIN